jgi:hypothetical protein
MEAEKNTTTDNTDLSLPFVFFLLLILSFHYYSHISGVNKTKTLENESFTFDIAFPFLSASQFFFFCLIMA